MTDDQYKRAKKIFLTVCDLPTEERRERLESACGGDAALRGEVQSLLDHYHGVAAAGTGATPEAATIPMPASAAPGRPTSERIGQYRVIHEIGRGGMGVVYLAVREDDQFKRRVAIKLLKRGMDSEDVLRRFELERQLLAALNHPGIARLYDGGETEQGIPYFVMEYIEGQRLDEYCDTHRLRIGERLELFRKVCAAVHYAHQNLIVHRDLKPSNIIVTKEGEPKLMDFGIAKLINPEFSLIAGDPTAPEFRVMTPEYASPEQVRGEPITTASDVYSLGVLLYEILSGHAPYRIRSRVRDELERVICDEDPERPSTAISKIEDGEVGEDGEAATTGTITPEAVSRMRESRPDRLRKQLSGDVDNIVLMAMRKEPQRRYTLAEQLASDIGRHLEGLPVIARADTFGYRVTKFVRRNRAGVAAGLAIAFLLVAGIVGTSWGWGLAVAGEKEASAARDAEAEQRALVTKHREQTIGVMQTLMGDINREISQLDGALPARELLAKTAHEQLTMLAQWAEGDTTLERPLARAHDRFGDLLGGIRNPSFGDVGTAGDSYRRSLEIREKLATQFPDDLEIKHELSTSLLNVAGSRLRQGDIDGAMAMSKRALAMCRELVAAASTPAHRRAVAVALTSVGDAHIERGDVADAMERYRESLRLREALLVEQPGDTTAERDVATIAIRIGYQLHAAGDAEGALAYFERALAARTRLARSNTNNARWRRDQGVAHYYLGGALIDLDRAKEALAQYERYLEISLQAIASNPRSRRAKRDGVLAHLAMAHVMNKLGAWEESLEHASSARLGVQTLVDRFPDDTAYRDYLVQALGHIAEAKGALGDTAGGIESAQAARAEMDLLMAGDPDNVGYRRDRGCVLLRLGRLFRQADRTGPALRWLDESRSLLEPVLAADPSNVNAREGLAEVHLELARIHRKLGEDTAAAEQTSRGLEVVGDPPATRRLERLRAELEER